MISHANNPQSYCFSSTLLLFRAHYAFFHLPFLTRSLCHFTKIPLPVLPPCFSLSQNLVMYFYGFFSPCSLHNFVLLCMRGHRQSICELQPLVWCLFAFWMILSFLLFIITCFHSLTFLSVGTQLPLLYTPVSEIYIHCPLIIIIKGREHISLCCVSCAFISSLEGLFGNGPADRVLKLSYLRQKMVFVLQWQRHYIPHLADYHIVNCLVAFY